ncbi:MAG: dihydrodipicolinate synthase family protein [Anaerolineae bacterium]
MSKPIVRGIFVPVVTPFDVHGEVALEHFQANAKKWLRLGLSGLVVTGSTGEAVSLDVDERTRLWEAARALIPTDRLLIAGTGAESTRATIALTKRAAETGADLALIGTPSYFHPFMTVEALTAHYRAVADAAPIPVVLYNIPRFTRVEMSAAVVVELSRHPNIIGIKDSSGNVGLVGQIAARTADDFATVTGSGATLFPALMVGAVGGILAAANLAPAQYIEIVRLYEAGEYAAARALQARLIPVSNLIAARMGPAGVKAGLDMLGFYGGPVRPPLLPISDSDRAVLRATLAEAELIHDA